MTRMKVDPMSFEVSKADAHERSRNDKRREYKQITYDCLSARVTEKHVVVCAHTDKDLGLLPVLRGTSMSVCHKCPEYRGDDPREE